MSEEIHQRCLVVGATGFQGGAVARLLAGRGHRVRSLTRRPAVARPDIAGVSFVAGDLGSRDDVMWAFKGATHAAVTMPLEYDPVRIQSYAANIAEAALENGVNRIVYNANTRVPPDAGMVAAFETRRLAEAVLRDSGVPLVVLRPPVYLDNLFSPWNGPALIDEGVLAYPLAADQRVGWISHDDLAVAMAAALFNDGLDGRVLDIGGQAVDGPGLAEEFATGLGRPVEYRALPAAAFEAALAKAIGATSAAGVAGIYHYMASGTDERLMDGDPEEAEQALGIKLTPIADWVAGQPWQTWSSRPL
ncbi:NmrA family NAD(P)-binding protein [Streptomyces sp. H10-C2]|uniref:SDR family oxidoreductase n=1 Tax=unclassified Streptomyces TaxID=2593676 RepID=UPI0024BAF331|nr:MULTISPECIES: NmrA family NAD(P)-binding protein [unclassified Streptomyces]MDJ0341457.1 NmrA family NAD(P)-binding protein [Streptomyces sp. PH10-H1]MDJ0369114.1 NmrA family NAD(P)-binding protein [Streptomyces sp. H10-C2]